MQGQEHVCRIMWAALMHAMLISEEVRAGLQKEVIAQKWTGNANLIVG